jgi:hypothetical protein
MNYSSKIKPIFKYCNIKHKLVSIKTCKCTDVCDMAHIIPYHTPPALQFYTNRICNITNFNQKIGDCLCTYKCSKICIDMP